MTTRPMLLVVCVGFYALAGSGEAAPRERDQAWAGLTPIGAQLAGNGGAIPAWNGGLKVAPAGFDATKGYLDPFVADRPLFVITARNLGQHAEKLSEGQQALFRAYPGFSMRVFPTRRSAAYPDRVYEEVRRQAGAVELDEGGNGLVNVGRSHVPFPFPKTGVEVVWNHSLRFRGNGIVRTQTSYAVHPRGATTPSMAEVRVMFANELANPPANRLLYYLLKVTGPPWLEGQHYLVHETINQVREPRLAWQYNAGQRRVLRAPELAYDTPSVGSDGLATADQVDMFNGSPDRYAWKLLGKREVYIPYNNYATLAADAKPTDLLTPLHPNPQMVRWELHRVWVVEGSLREGARHIYSRRVFYMDEDSWSIALADHYDARGELWRVSFALLSQLYDGQTTWTIGDAHLDLQSRRYYMQQFLSRPVSFGVAMSLNDFSPLQLRRAGIR